MPRKSTLLIVGLLGLAWSVIGTELFERIFAMEGPIAPISALVLLLLLTAVYARSKDLSYRSAASVLASAVMSYVIGFVLYFAWSASTSMA